MISDATDIALDACLLAQHRHHLRNVRMTCIADLLNANEHDRVDAYTNRWASLSSSSRCAPEDLVCHIGDNPGPGWCTWSAVSGAIPTIRRSNGILYMPFARRHVTLKELFAVMGYPSFPSLAAAAGVNCFNVHHHPVSYATMRRALGNSMHVAQIGIWMGVHLACTMPKA